MGFLYNENILNINKYRIWNKSLDKILLKYICVGIRVIIYIGKIKST